MRYMLTGDSSTDWNRDPYLMIVDVSDPLNMSVVKRVKLSGDCGTFLYDSGRLYCLEREFFEVFDISNIEEIGLLKRIEGYNGGHLLLEENSNLLYLSNWRRGIAILDVSKRDDPIPLGIADCDCIDPVPAGNDGPYGIADGLCLRGNYLLGVSMDYLLSRNIGALYVYDISDPSNPRKVTKIPTRGFRAHGMDSKGNYVFAVGATGVLTFDISIPDDPVIVGEMAVNNRFYVSAEIVDNLLFAVGVILDSEERSGVLDIIDISNPIHLKTAGSITLHQNIALNIEIIGSLSYIACGSGVAVVDVSKQESPKLLSALDATQGRANWGVKILETE